ncbi:calcium/sodium antiporter [Nanoarchaeota archaeon]
MVIELILLILGLILLIKGANLIVDSGAKLAKAFGISEFVIGLTIVAIGTSLPELAASISAAISNDSTFIVGNIIGSNIANISLVLGLSVLMGAITFQKKAFNRSSWLFIIINIVFLLTCLDQTLTRIEGALMFILFIIYIIYLYQPQPDEKERKYGGFLNELYKIRNVFRLKNLKSFFIKLFRARTYVRIFHRIFKRKTPKGKYEEIKKEIEKEPVVDSLVFLIGIIIIYFGAKFTVDNAIGISDILGITTNFISLTLVAFGTSLPEIVVTIVAVKRGLGNIVIGNIIGSNITNILLIGGISSMILPLKILDMTLLYTLPFMLLMSVIFLIILKFSKKLHVWEGIILLTLYITFILGLAYILFF